MPAPTSHRLNLARKYRPKRLEDVLGQPVAVKTLSEALRKDRIAPAYLFSGPRGTGKTTCARIFARAATCLSKAPESRPCEKCASCEAHAAGKIIDLIEIDGASHTGVDDARSIIDAVAFRPSVGARNVYIIDEVHMLSNAAFNALLKTLEEPPSHALFLFATTEPDKIPTTILSRVQRIELQRIKETEIFQNLKMICAAENILTADHILEQVATASDGSLRDAQTLLEQLTLLSGSLEVDQSMVDSFLGTVGTAQEIEIFEGIAKKDISALLEKAKLFFQQGKDLPRLLNRLLHWARILLLTKATGSKNFVQQECAEDHLDRLMKAFEVWGVEDSDRLLEIIWSGCERMKKSELPRITLETTLIRAARIPLTEDLTRLLKALETQPVAASAPISVPHSGFSPPARPKPAAAPTEFQAPSTAPQVVATNTEELLAEIKRKRPTVFAIVNCADTKEWAGDALILRFPKGHFAFRQVSEKILQKELTDLVQLLSQNTCKRLQIEENVQPAEKLTTPPRDFMKEAQKVLLNDPAVQKAAKLLEGNIESMTISGIRVDSKNQS